MDTRKRETKGRCRLQGFSLITHNSKKAIVNNQSLKKSFSLC